ncbi:hydantoinase B/oxoprolinase family protein [Nakamurella sp. YIM 132087]|uniref:Hydantoinase B/oxoprolinase family protein n=1 Tax=Nakamurella alba TaxID=2665158 RepID=A0A7K1FWH7_9ACTN|nr:hydantoinase B/oxoprolinase family protein [Nakamurella alba]MTD17174.1 hydantoinase B/oxoprolinase family protein [Nakamurella alba]
MSAPTETPDRSAVPELDGVTLEVIRNNLLSITEQMRRTLIRAAFNPGIYEVLDFGLSMYDKDVRLIAEAAGVATFLGSNDIGIKHGLDHVGVENLDPGDVLLLNYPYWSSAHSYDALLFAPVHLDGEIIGYLAERAHWRDLGAKDAGYVLDSTDMHQEGLIFPGTKIVKKGVPDKDIYDLIRFNSRMPDIVFGDLGAMLSSIEVGARRMQELHQKFGSPLIGAAVERIIEHGERRTRRALAALPKGTWHATDAIDDDGIGEDPVHMQVAVTITDDEFIVDFTGSAGQQRGPVNMPFGSTVSLAKLIFKALTTPNDTANAGHFTPLRVIAPEGSLFHAVYPAPTFTLWTGHIALDMVKTAVAQAIPELGASTAGDEPGFMGVVEGDGGKGIFVISSLEPIGWGANNKHDGASAQQCMNVNVGRNTPIEVLEQKAGMLHHRVQLRTDSGGAGRYRGGVGVLREISYTRPGEILSMKKKTLGTAHGLAGGGSAEPSGMIIHPETDRAKALRMRRAPLQPGESFVTFTGGGGGYGDPLERPAAEVLDDVLDGFVSVEKAWETYGVRITDGAVAGVDTSRRPS